MPNLQLDLSPLCPPVSASPETKLAWLLGSKSRAESGLKNGDAYRTVDQTIDIIANRVMNKVQQTRGKRKSNITVNRIKRQLREIIALLTQRIKPKWDYRTQNELWDDIASILTKRLKCWLDTNLFDRKLKEALQWGVCGAGYLLAGWSRPIPGFMDSDLDIDVLGPDDVLRDQGSDLQECYAVHIRRLFNLSEAIARMPLSRNYLKPLRTRVTTRAQDARKVSGWLSPLLNAIGYNRAGGDAGDNVNSYGFLGTDIEVNYTYVLDTSLNTTGQAIHSDDLCYDMMTGIKTRNTTWEYEVPSMGTQVQIDQAGHTKVVLPEQAMLYPTRRLLIWTEDHLVYDGPSFYWHSRVPVVQLSLDKWPWEQIGYSLAMGNLSMADAVNQILRGVVDTFQLKMDPPLWMNKKEISDKEGKKLDMREPGARLMRSGLLPASDVVGPIMAGGYEIPQQTQPVLQQLMQMMDHDVGVADVSSLLELQQAPSADSTERLLQAQGPLATDYARELEKAITEFGYLAGWLFMQFDNTAKRLQLLGQDGLTFTDFDYDPGKLLPVDVHGLPINATLMQRALVFGRQFSFRVVPNSIFEFTDTQDKLFKFQLWRDGRFPIDPWTLAEAWNLGNFGEPKGTTIYERSQEWQAQYADQQATIMAMAQVKAQQIAMQGQAQMMSSPEGQAMMMLQQAMGGGGQGQQGGGAGSNGTGGHNGRPPSGQQPPHIVAKGSLSDPRNSTVSES